MYMLGRGFNILIRNVSFPPSPTNVGSHSPLPWGLTNVGSHSPLPWGLVSSLTHYSMSGSDTICNSLSSPLVDIVRFTSLHIVVSLMVLRGFHTLIRNALFSTPTNVGSHNPPPFEAQCPRWHSFLTPIDVGSHNPPPWTAVSSLAYRLVSGSNTICNSSSSLLVDIVCFGPLRMPVSLTVSIREKFPRSYKKWLVILSNQPMWDLTHSLKHRSI